MADHLPRDLHPTEENFACFAPEDHDVPKAHGFEGCEIAREARNVQQSEVAFGQTKAAVTCP